ncbi:MAG: FmdB family zinc ribbon protein [Gammaproteobacteria bacterium]
MSDTNLQEYQMPIYEYVCGGCEHVFDALQKMDAKPLTECPECGEPKLRKLLSAPNFRLKGGGWYETDFKKDKQRNLADGGPKKTSAEKPAKSDKPGGSAGKNASGKGSESGT